MSDNIINSTQGTIATGDGETDLRGYVSEPTPTTQQETITQEVAEQPSENEVY